MVVNLYELKDTELVDIPKKELPGSIKRKLDVIETEIIKVFIKEQKGHIGITTLGNQIRNNEIIKKQWGDVDDRENVLVKLTENRRSFFNVFIETLFKYPSKDIYFIILEREFGKESKLVDGSFIYLTVIRSMLELFFKVFRVQGNLGKIIFVEIEGFEGYHFEVNGKYSKMCKNA
jgi:hypothetical protein